MNILPSKHSRFFRKKHSELSSRRYTKHSLQQDQAPPQAELSADF
jgi:hypothetical protein